MEYNVFQHIDTYIEISVEASTEEEALELGRQELELIDDEEFTRQVLANCEPGEIGVS